MLSGRKEGPMFNISEDEIMTELLSKLDQFEEQIDTIKNERKERLYPKRFATHGSADPS